MLVRVGDQSRITLRAKALRISHWPGNSTLETVTRSDQSTESQGSCLPYFILDLMYLPSVLSQKGDNVARGRCTNHLIVVHEPTIPREGASTRISCQLISLLLGRHRNLAMVNCIPHSPLLSDDQWKPFLDACTSHMNSLSFHSLQLTS